MLVNNIKIYQAEYVICMNNQYSFYGHQHY